MLFEELGKIKRNTIMAAIVLVAFGIVMIMCPAQYVSSLVSLLGFGLVTFALVMILDFITGKKALINYFHLTLALVLLLLGIAVLVFEDIVLIIGIAFGLVLMLDGIFTVVNTWMYVRRSRRKGWQVLILLALVLFAFGLLILINPWWNEPKKLFDVIGATLLFTSLVSIVRLIIIWPIRDE